MKYRDYEKLSSFLRDALKSNELMHALRTWMESDSKKQTLQDFTATEMVEEAKEILYWVNANDSYLCDDLESKDPMQRKWAHNEIKTLKSFIKKYEGVTI